MAFCPRCGKETLLGASFCAYCGETLPELSPRLDAKKAVQRGISVPDRASLAGKCAIIHTGNDKMDIRRVGRYVSEATGAPLSDVTRRIRATKGFVTIGIPHQSAVALAERLEKELNTQVLVVPEEECVPLPPAMRMRRISMCEEGIECEVYTWDRSEGLNASWDEVFLVSCGRLALERVAEREKKAKESSNPFERLVPDLVTDRYYEFLLDIILFQPWRRFRLDYNVAAYAFRDSEPDPQQVLGALHKCARGLVDHGKTVPMNQGVSLLASRAPDWEWESMTFLSKLDFDSYSYWLLQLVRYGYTIPL